MGTHSAARRGRGAVARYRRFPARARYRYTFGFHELAERLAPRAAASAGAIARTARRLAEHAPTYVGSRLARLEVPRLPVEERGERPARVPAFSAMTNVPARIARRGPEHDRDAFGGFEH